MASIPLLGLGTWELKEKKCFEVVSEALKLGYRHVDTAHEYQNHRPIGAAIKGYPREELFLTTKISPLQVDDKRVESSVQAACELALKELGVESIDLYLIHYPEEGMPFIETFQAMERLLQQGKVQQVGVSNFTLAHLEDLKKVGGYPHANQVEFHPYLYQKDLLDYCHRHQIALISHRSLGKRKGREEGKFSDDPLLQEIGRAYGKSWAQVILRWLVQRGIHVIPKASSLERLRENSEIFDFELSPQTMLCLDELHSSSRFCMDGDPIFEYRGGGF